jgi:putative OPT family oligopeptide transporter
LLTLVRTLPTMIESFRVGARAMKADLRGGAVAGANAIPRTERDLSLRTIALVAIGAAVLVAAIPHLLGPVTSPVVRITAALLVLVFAFFFATVSSRIVGLVGVTSNPTSGMTIAALLGTTLIFYLAGWTDDVGKVAALLIGTIVCTAASIAGDTSQDLKTGFLLGATPRKQQIGQLAGVLTSGIFVCGTLLVLDRAYGLGSKALPAPQANLMKLVIEGVLHAELPWTLVGIGAGLAAIAAVLRLPVLAFAVGVYLPVSTMVPVFAGGVLRALLERRAGNATRAEAIRDRGTLFASGLVGGEGLVGVGIAAAAFALGHAPEGIGHEWAGPLAPLVGLAAFAFLLYLLARSARGARG